MSNHFSHYGEANEMPILDTDALVLSEAHMETVRGLFDGAPLDPEFVAVRAAHVFDRKGFYSTNDFAGGQNGSYRGSSDDIIVQVTMVVRAEHKPQYAALSGVYSDVQKQKYDADVAAKQAAVDAAQNELDAARRRLAETQVQANRV